MEENWIRESNPRWFRRIALPLKEKHDRYEQELLNKGLRPVRIPHPEWPNTFIIKYQ